MRSAIQFVILLVVLAYASGYAPQIDLSKAPELFVKFIKEYRKVYQNHYDLLIHYESFKEALKEINRLNSLSGVGGPVFGINNFTDYTKDEGKYIWG